MPEQRSQVRENRLSVEVVQVLLHLHPDAALIGTRHQRVPPPAVDTHADRDVHTPRCARTVAIAAVTCPHASISRRGVKNRTRGSPRCALDRSTNSVDGAPSSAAMP